MALDFRWVDVIHTRLLVRYGAKWLAQTAPIDEEMLKADWADVLDGLSGKAIKHALFLSISFLIANTFLAYIIGTEELTKIVTDAPTAHLGGLAALTACGQRRIGPDR